MAKTKAASRRRRTNAVPKEVHRGLHLVTPLMRGADVRALQSALKKELAHHKIDWLPLRIDGQVGPQTIHAARFLTWVLGLGRGHREPIQKRHTITEATQRLLRNPEERTGAEKRREKRRRSHLARIRKAQTEGPAAAVAGARACIGITEEPAGSNAGPDRTVFVLGKKVVVGVSAFERYWGLGACYWCLCFACFWLRWAGAKISGNCTFSVAIEGYARNHENGFIQVPAADARPGDLAIWKFDGPDAPSDHGELIVEVAKGIGPKEDVGGNTSSEGGSQSNGGGVFPKTVGSGTRPTSELSMCVRVLFKP
jgi:hypothetical protein